MRSIARLSVAPAVAPAVLANGMSYASQISIIVRYIYTTSYCSSKPFICSPHNRSVSIPPHITDSLQRCHLRALTLQTHERGFLQSPETARQRQPTGRTSEIAMLQSSAEISCLSAIQKEISQDEAQVRREDEREQFVVQRGAESDGACSTIARAE